MKIARKWQKCNIIFTLLWNSLRLVSFLCGKAFKSVLAKIGGFAAIFARSGSHPTTAAVALIVHYNKKQNIILF